MRKNLIDSIQNLASSISLNELALRVLNNEINTFLEKEAKRVLPGCNLQVYKLKPVKRVQGNTKELIEKAKEMGSKTAGVTENPEAENLIEQQMRENAEN